MVTTEQIFTAFWEDVSNQFRQRGRSLGEITSGSGREAWQSLDIRTQTAIQIFSNAIAKRPDDVHYFSREIKEFFQGHTAADILGNASALRILKLFLGEEE